MLTLTSRAEGEDASEVFVEAGRVEGPKPAAWTGRGETGTRIEVRDLFHATSVHRLLQELLGLPVPVYHHHDLVMGDDGRKLSKSRRDTALRSLRDAGATPDDIRRMVGL